MTSKIDDGGQAFPQPVSLDLEGRESIAYPGLTVRQWFAGQALAGLVGNSGGPYQANSQTGWDIVNCNVSHVAATCYEIADAMIAAGRAGVE